LARLIAAFRDELARLRERARPPTGEAAALEELAEYESRGFPVYVCQQEGARLSGYLVCRVDGRTVWAESMYVVPEHRREGIGTALYAEAERLAARLGAETVYNWVDPNNDAIIGFLRHRGYSVLNLIELRRPRPADRPRGTIIVGRHEFQL
jgi:ribosomal protein S18 acetylase RimI-like enzyme